MKRIVDELLSRVDCSYSGLERLPRVMLEVSRRALVDVCATPSRKPGDENAVIATMLMGALSGSRPNEAALALAAWEIFHHLDWLINSEDRLSGQGDLTSSKEAMALVERLASAPPLAAPVAEVVRRVVVHGEWVERGALKRLPPACLEEEREEVARAKWVLREATRNRTAIDRLERVAMEALDGAARALDARPEARRKITPEYVRQKDDKLIRTLDIDVEKLELGCLYVGTGLQNARGDNYAIVIHISREQKVARASIINEAELNVIGMFDDTKTTRPAAWARGSRRGRRA